MKINAKKGCSDTKNPYTKNMTENATFPATPAEYEEYCSVMEQMADEAEASTPDPRPIHFSREDFVPASEIVPAGFSTVRSVR